MCVTKRLTYMVCLHTDSYKKKCLHPPASFLGRFITCKQRTRSASQYGLCHECRQIWAAHGVDEQQATLVYQNYRNAHAYDGPLSPGYVIAEEHLALTEHNVTSTFSSQAAQLFTDPNSMSNDNIQDITSVLYGGRREKPSSRDSTLTLWPALYSPSEGPTKVCQSQERKGKEKESERNASSLRRSNTRGALFLTEDDSGPGPPKYI